MKKFTDGLFKQNPLFVLFLGLCVSLGTSATFISGVSMAICAAIVLVITSIIIAIVSKALNKESKLIASVIVSASLTSILKMLLEAYAPGVIANFGIFFPLLAVSSLVITGATTEESIGGTIAGSLGMAIGFILSMALISLLRELLATGSIVLYNPLATSGVVSLTTVNVLPASITLPFFATPFGAFLTFGTLGAIFAPKQNKKEVA